MSIKIKKRVSRDAEKEMAAKIGLFNKLPDHCMVCESSFDKKNREMVKTWYVVVRDQSTVRLYCPTCWTKAQEFLKEVEDETS